ncbi:methyl-accepting chemotaxis protein [Serratia sp. Se-RSBMAAmG]|uniref:methyl-accepting chemotaxis protein n=1 Tax=Serratia sp. Se-RSBMAAmG TaxID=3043305 RepID=UPI0024AF7688|nr:methyl-accepting chemotaxis protein [Serratia sp. Se-RSBMAAmG]MDI6977651.1 methyl-accepting chemotaxis protein [Serratia sp. Se-RSBMAAmG]
MKTSRNSSGLSSNTWIDSNQQSLGNTENSEYTGYDNPAYDEKAFDENINVKKLPIIGRLKKSTQYILASLGLAVSGGLLFGSIWYNHNNAIDLQVSKDAANELNFLVGQSKSEIKHFISNDATSFSQLKSLYVLIDKDINYIAGGNKLNESSLKDLTDYWAKVKQSLDNILSSQETITKTNKSLDEVSSSMTSVTTDALSALNNMSKPSANANQKQVVYLSQIITILQRMDKNMVALKAPNANYQTIVSQIWNDNKVLPLAYNALLKGNSSLGTLQSKEITDQLTRSFNNYQAISPMIIDIAQNLNNMSKMIEANNKVIATNSNGIIEGVKTSLLNYERSLSLYENLVWVFAVLFASFICLLMAINTKENQKSFLALKQERAMINDGVSKMIEDLSVVGQGNLGHKIRLSEGRLMSLSDSINTTIGKVSDIIRNNILAIEKIGITAKEQLEINESIRAKYKEQNGKINETVTFFIEINTILQELDRMLKTSQDISNKSGTSIVRGTDAIETAQKSISEINTKIKDAQSRASNLWTSTNEISEIAANLMSLSERMDVLAIHAKVQAAKAGDAGQGFSYIADGVKDMATFFSENSKRINALIDTTLQQITAINGAIKSSIDEIDEGTRLTTIVDNSFGVLDELSGHLSDSIKKIDEKYQFQKDQYEKITSSINNVVDVNEDISKSNNEMSRKISDLNKETETLNKELKVFNLKNPQK